MASETTYRVFEDSEVEWKPAGTSGFEGPRRPFATEVKRLPAGWTESEGVRPLSADTIWDKDHPIQLRDGTTIYCDIFRPASSEDSPVPALLAWGPFDKSSNGVQKLDRLPYRAGVPKHQTSGLENWEAPDPADWVGRGYAVVNICSRGSADSEGRHVVYGTQEGRDGYDAIEHIAKLVWCTGKTCMVGNSWLVSAQWFIAAERPPSLTAIAPWEGLGDYYRETIVRGGIPDFAFWELLLTKLVAGRDLREDVASMVSKKPLIDTYWLDKKPRLDQISIPMYALMSYSTNIHTEGSFRGYFLSNSTEKWLRIHNTHEWHDMYQPHNADELQRFCDYYLKGILNGWEATPKIRLSLLGYNRPDVVNRAISEYPPPEFQYQTFYLDARTRSLQGEAPTNNSTASYDSEMQNDARMSELVGLGFEHKFKHNTELCGWSKATLYMSAESSDDMDVYVILRKLDKDGKALFSFNIPFRDLPEGLTEADIPLENVWRYVGPNGRLRASHRAVGVEPGLTDAQRKQLSPAYVWHPHTQVEKLKQGEVVRLDIHLWPGGIIFGAGEFMRLEVKGVQPAMPEFEPLLNKSPNSNRGLHTIHTGPANQSTFSVALSVKE